MNDGSHRAVRLALGGLITLAAGMGIGRFVYTPILPFMVESLGLSKSQAGLIASANYLGYLLGALAASMATLPGGRRTWFLAALLASALTTGAMGLSASLPLLTGLRFAGGVASAFVLVFSSALIFDRLAKVGRSNLSAVYFAGVGSGIVVSALLVSGVSALGFDWRSLWFSSGIVALLALAAVIWLVPGGAESERPAPEPQGEGIDRRLIALAVAYGLFGFGYVITATFISTMVRTSPDLQSIESLVWPVVGLTAAPSVALWYWIARRLGDGRSFALACLIEAAGVAMSVLLTSEWGILLSAGLLGGTFMGIASLGFVNATNLSTADPRRLFALMTAAFGLGQMIGPTFAGVVYDLSGSLLIPSLVAALALVVAAVLVLDDLHVWLSPSAYRRRLSGRA